MPVTPRVNFRDGNAKMTRFWESREKIYFLTMAIDKKRTLCFIRDQVYGADGKFMEPQMIYALEVMKVRSLEFFFFPFCQVFLILLVGNEFKEISIFLFSLY